MTIIASKKKIGRNPENTRAIAKVKDFSGTSALFSTELLNDAIKVLKTMGAEEVEVGVDRESDALLFFMDEDKTIAYALAPRKREKEEEEE